MHLLISFISFLHDGYEITSISLTQRIICMIRQEEKKLENTQNKKLRSSALPCMIYEGISIYAHIVNALSNL